MRATAILLIALAAAAAGAAPAEAARGAAVRAKPPVKKASTSSGVSFAGAYRTVGTAHRLAVRVALQYRVNGHWSTFVDSRLRKNRARRSHVAVRGRGPCLLGSDVYRTVARGFVIDDRGRRKLRRRDVSAPRRLYC